VEPTLDELDGGRDRPRGVLGATVRQHERRRHGAELRGVESAGQLTGQRLVVEDDVGVEDRDELAVRVPDAGVDGGRQAVVPRPGDDLGAARAGDPTRVVAGRVVDDDHALEPAAHASGVELLLQVCSAVVRDDDAVHAPVPPRPLLVTNGSEW
jgi:hypothetical protein